MRIDRLVVYLITGIAVFLPVLAESTSNPDYQPIFDLIIKLNTYPVFTMDFQQETSNRSSGQTIRARGTVTFATPDKFRWDYVSEPQNILASDGKVLTMLLPKDHQAIQEPARKQRNIWSPLHVLTDADNLVKSFSIQPILSGKHSKWKYKLIPLSKATSYDYLLLEWSLPTHPISFSLTIFDLAGNKNILVFSNYQKQFFEPDFSPPIPAGFEITDFNGRPVDPSSYKKIGLSGFQKGQS